MAQRRVFSLKIVNSDAFVDMPSSAQALYFHLGMRADDDGFVNPKGIMRLINSSDDDLLVLLGKRFILKFDNGVIVIKHWLIHNNVQKDRYYPTLYTEEKKLLMLKDNKAYTECIQNVNKMLTEPNLTKLNLTKPREKKSEASSLTPVKKEEKKKYGEFKNVLLTDEEYVKLTLKFKDSLSSLIERLSSYVASKGRRYSSHYATLLTWSRREEEKRDNRGKSVAIIQ